MDIRLIAYGYFAIGILVALYSIVKAIRNFFKMEQKGKITTWLKLPFILIVLIVFALFICVFWPFVVIFPTGNHR